MRELVVGLDERSYPIFIEEGLLDTIGEDLAKRKAGNRYCIISDTNVAPLYGEKLLQSLEKVNIKAKIITIPAGESSKNLSLFAELCSEMAQQGFDRKDCIIALGGGVVGDLAGYVAASFMRGIPFIQIPTSLLAQVDSSVGGKTGVDIPEGKNLVGAFYQPRAVYIDLDVLKTLDYQEFLGGMAEVIKYGVIWDQSFFKQIEENREQILQLDNAVLKEVIHTCCSIKAEVVEKDEQESNLRRILNYGHTIGHSVEAVSNFSIIHGKAVAIGMVAAARIAELKGILSREDVNTIKKLIEKYELPVEIPESFNKEEIKKYLLTDKKVEAGKVFYILPNKIGEVVITSDISEDIIDKVLSGS